MRAVAKTFIRFFVVLLSFFIAFSILNAPVLAAVPFTTTVDGITFSGTGTFYNANLNEVVRNGTRSNLPLYTITGHHDWDINTSGSTFLLHFKMTGVNGKQMVFKHKGSPSPLQRFWYRYGEGNWQLFSKANEVVTEGSSQVAYSESPVFSASAVEIATFLPFGEAEIVQLNAVVAAHAHGQVFTIGQSPQNRPVYAYEITDPTVANSTKKNIVVISGQHGYEMLGIRAVNHFVRLLLTADPQAVRLRQKARIFVYPFINTDGIANGNHRANMLNVDLNRGWLTNENDPPVVDKAKAVEVNLARADIVARTGGRAHVLMDVHNTEFFKLNHSYAGYEHPVNTESRAFLAKLAQRFGTISNSYVMTMKVDTAWADAETNGYTAGGWGKGKLNANISLTPELTQFNDGDLTGPQRIGEAFVRALDDILGGGPLPSNLPTPRPSASPRPSPSASVRPSPSATPTPEDVNQDGVVNLIDLKTVIQAWGLVQPVRADINQDGRINMFDTAFVIRKLL